jgi:serine/threonine protein kinase
MKEDLQLEKDSFTDTRVLPPETIEETIKLEDFSFASSNEKDTKKLKRNNNNTERNLLSLAQTSIINFITGKKKNDVDEKLNLLQEDENQLPSISGIDAQEKLEANYEVKKSFAEGGQGTVSEAVDKVLSRQVAVKSLHEHLSNDKYARNNFINEARLTALLDHPSIVPIHGLCTDENGGCHVVMKLIQGESLKSYLENIRNCYEDGGINNFDERKSLFFRLEIFLRVLEAIEYAHAKGIIHCDIKPENIMMGKYRETYVMDWGIARRLDDPATANLKDEKHLMGSPRFIAPEILSRQGRFITSDIYSLGVVLFEIVTLDMAFPGDNLKDIVQRVLSGNMAPIVHKYGESIENDLAAIIRKATAFNPQDRYQSAADFATDLRHYMSKEEVSANPDKLLGKIARWSFRHKKGMFISFLITALLGTTLAGRVCYLEWQQAVTAQHREHAIKRASTSAFKVGNMMELFFFHQTQQLAIIKSSLELLARDKDISKVENTNLLLTAKDFAKENKKLGIYYSKAYDETISVNNSSYHKVANFNRELLSSLLSRYGKIDFILQESVLGSLISNPLTYNNKAYLKNRLIKEALPVRWAYAGLASGIFFTYPGRGKLLNSYDHRQRSWYQDAIKQAGLPVWGRPYFNAGSKDQMVMTCSMEVRNNNQTLGVVGLDIAMQDLVKYVSSHGNLEKDVLIEKYLIDYDGKIIIDIYSKNLYKNDVKVEYDSQGNIIYPNFPNRAVFNDMRNHSYGHSIKEENGRKVLYVYFAIKSIKALYVEKVDFDALLTLHEETGCQAEQFNLSPFDKNTGDIK